MKSRELWTATFLSGLSLGLSTAALAFNLCRCLEKNGSVCEDGVGKAAAVIAARGEAGQAEPGHQDKED